MNPGGRHVPLRTCLICGNKAPKRDLTRIVSTPDDRVKIDRIGKLSGRGAYVCSDVQCAPSEVKRGRIEHALRGPIADNDWTILVAAIEARGTWQS